VIRNRFLQTFPTLGLLVRPLKGAEEVKDAARDPGQVFDLPRPRRGR